MEEFGRIRGVMGGNLGTSWTNWDEFDDELDDEFDDEFDDELGRTRGSTSSSPSWTTSTQIVWSPPASTPGKPIDDESRRDRSSCGSGFRIPCVLGFW